MENSFIKIKVRDLQPGMKIKRLLKDKTVAVISIYVKLATGILPVADFTIIRPLLVSRTMILCAGIQIMLFPYIRLHADL